VIRAAAPALSRWFVPGTPPGAPGMTMTMIGYGLRLVADFDQATTTFIDYTDALTA